MNRTVQILIAVLLVILCLGLLPTWPYSTNWGYYPSGGAGLLLIIVLVLLLMGARGRAV